jgi:acyl carrier protein
MTNDDILKRVQQVIGKQFSVRPEQITRDITALDVFGWDSVTHVYLLLAIEQEFGVKIPDDRVFSMENVGQLVDVLAEQTQKR